MKIAVYMKVKDEGFYIDMALKSIVNHADIFVLDTGSKDETIDVIKGFQYAYHGKLVLEQQDFGSQEDRWSPLHRNIDGYNYAMNRAIEIFNPDWVVTMDGDEIYLSSFWKAIREAEQAGKQALGYPEVVPVTYNMVCDNKEWYATWTLPGKNGNSEHYSMFDPHIKAWSVKSGIKWIPRNAGENLHPIPDIKDLRQLCVVNDHMHVHFHHSFGPKSIYNYILGHKTGKLFSAPEACDHLGIDRKDAYNQAFYKEKYPYLFKGDRFIPPKQEGHWMKETALINHPLPEYVIRRWWSWGELPS